MYRYLAMMIAAFFISDRARAEESSPFSMNVSIASEYSYRGISQTRKRPALQGGFDFKHESGFYVGAWASSISWLRDAEPAGGESSGNALELDLYGGYARQFGDFGAEIGVLQYRYPGRYNAKWQSETGLKPPQTTEGYAAVSWKWINFKYSRSFSDLFGAPDSRGSEYYDATLSYEWTPKLKLDAHIGRQTIKGPSKSYSDWKFGVSYTLHGVDLGLHCVGTNLANARELNAHGRAILSIKKVF